MGLEHRFHKWPFGTQQQQIISQLISPFTKEAQINTFLLHSYGLATHLGESSLATVDSCSAHKLESYLNTFSKPSESSSKISLFLFKEQVNNHILKREPKGKMKDPSQTRNEQALILSRRTLVEPRRGNAKYQQVLHARSSLLFQFNVQLIIAV